MNASAKDDPVREIRLRGEILRLLPEGALYWPRERLLVIADLHLGKAETFGRHGFPLPARAGVEDLRRLEAAAAREGARKLLVLGDLVHAREGITPDIVARFAETIARFPEGAILAAGNHDRGIVRSWPAGWSGMAVVDRFERGPFEFRHELPSGQEAAADPFIFAGHVHPCVRLVSGVDHLRMRTFVLRAGTGLLPAFTALAGGFDVARTADARFYPIAEGRVFELP